MSTQEKEKEVVSTVETTTTHTDAAQARLQELRLMRDRIPRFVIPAFPTETMRLSNAASVPPEFVELTTVAIANEKVLARGEGTSPAEMRDLMSYADAYGPVADELEALAHFVRHSVTAARNKAGSEALTTYSLTQRLAKRPEHARLVPYAADMRRALGRVRKLSPEVLARRAAKKAAKQAASPATTQPS
jgi:hypothetical protein